MAKLRELNDDLRKYLFDDRNVTEMNTDLNLYEQFLPLVNFQPSLYELLFVERYAFWKLYSLQKGVPFLSLRTLPPKEFDDFVNEWVATHEKPRGEEEIPPREEDPK